MPLAASIRLPGAAVQGLPGPQWALTEAQTASLFDLFFYQKFSHSFHKFIQCLWAYGLGSKLETLYTLLPLLLTKTLRIML